MRFSFIKSYRTGWCRYLRVSLWDTKYLSRFFYCEVFLDSEIPDIVGRKTSRTAFFLSIFPSFDTIGDFLCIFGVVFRNPLKLDCPFAYDPLL